MNQYQELIRKLDPDVYAPGVEASMRLEYGTLDHLDLSTFNFEIKLAKAIEREKPGFLHSIAKGFWIINW